MYLLIHISKIHILICILLLSLSTCKETKCAYHAKCASRTNGCFTTVSGLCLQNCSAFPLRTPKWCFSTGIICSLSRNIDNVCKNSLTIVCRGVMLASSLFKLEILLNVPQWMKRHCLVKNYQAHSVSTTIVDKIKKESTTEQNMLSLKRLMSRREKMDDGNFLCQTHASEITNL